MYFFSAAGPLVEWGACTPEAGVDCAFAVVDSSSSDFAGADLNGIDLAGADLSDADFGAPP